MLVCEPGKGRGYISVIKHLDLGTDVALITICNTLLGTPLLSPAGRAQERMSR